MLMIVIMHCKHSETFDTSKCKECLQQSLYFSVQEYSMKQLTNLVNVCLGSHINKKARQKLLAAIDDIDRPKR